MRTDPVATETAADARGGRRGRLRLLACALPFVAFALTELALRLADFPPRAEIVELTQVLDLRDRRNFEADTNLLWRFRPDTDYDLGDPAFPPFRTNAQGLRGPPVPLAHEPAELRVLCLGDSITFGIGVTDPFTLPTRVQAHLQADPRLAGRPIRVINGGVPGYSSVQGLRLLRQLAEQDPDVVVWCFGMNDAKPSLGRPDRELRLADRPPVSAFRERAIELNVIRALTALVSADRSEEARVSADDARDTIDEAFALLPPPRVVIVVETPQRLDLVVEQLGRVLAAAHAADATIVRGPDALLSPWTPSWAPGDPLHRIETTVEGTRGVVFGDAAGGAEAPTAVSEIESRLEFTRSWRNRLRAIEARLPEDRITRDELLGRNPGGAIFIDNCHLTARGNDTAAEVIARRILQQLFP